MPHTSAGVGAILLYDLSATNVAAETGFFAMHELT
jgi:hypothetical protein